jgi:hypothetical protein
MQQQPKPPFPRQHQPMPGRTDQVRPKADHGEESYRGSGKLAGKKAVITGADRVASGGRSQSPMRATGRKALGKQWQSVCGPEDDTEERQQRRSPHWQS